MNYLEDFSTKIKTSISCNILVWYPTIAFTFGMVSLTVRTYLMSTIEMNLSIQISALLAISLLFQGCISTSPILAFNIWYANICIKIIKILKSKIEHLEMGDGEKRDKIEDCIDFFEQGIQKADRLFSLSIFCMTGKNELKIRHLLY